MKKFYILLMFIIFSIPFLNLGNSFLSSYANSNIYAKVEDSGIFLYSSPIDSQQNKLFEIPQSYFVRLIEKTNDMFYYCAYKDVYGYAKISEVVAMNGQPNSPFFEGYFRVFALEGQGLYSSPQIIEEDKVTHIPSLTDNLIFYGYINGQEAVPDTSDKWIYCKYSDSKNNYGYTYSVFCDKIPKITENTERFEILSEPFSKDIESGELSTVAMTFIIIGVSLPCLVVIYLLIKPTLLKGEIEMPKRKLKAKRHHDYFEFDDSDLN